MSQHHMGDLFPGEDIEELGKIAIRVVVLPPKPKKRSSGSKVSPETQTPLDLDADEIHLVEEASTPVGSYLESSKGGRRCVVFLVNGQRHDFLDNSFIVKELGFKYLRNRMMISVEVDSLSPESIAKLTQGSRQGFYKGDVYDAIKKRIVSALKNDPDLERLEEAAEAQIAELETGDEKVKSYLNQLIEDHHKFGLNLTEGPGFHGSGSGEGVGSFVDSEGKVVSLFDPNRGAESEYPVLVSQPPISSIRLKPNEPRTIRVKSTPPNAWPALADLTAQTSKDVPELKAEILHLPDGGELTLEFKEPDGFDPENYPVKSKVVVTGGFNGVEEPRQLVLGVSVRPDKDPPPPVLLDDPTELLVKSRQPIKIRSMGADTHVKLRWNGKDDLLLGSQAPWSLNARLIKGSSRQPNFTFSNPTGGRFDLLIEPGDDWVVGDQMTFEVIATGPNDRNLSVLFTGEVVEPPQAPGPKEPRIIDATFPSGAERRPPYNLMYIGRDKYEEVPCWTEPNWTGAEPGCYLDPSESRPLTIIINKDMTALKLYKNTLVKEKRAESEIERRITKYTSHVAFHLYQMHQANKDAREEDENAAEKRKRDEIQRVSMTLIRLMEVSR